MMSLWKSLRFSLIKKNCLFLFRKIRKRCYTDDFELIDAQFDVNPT